MNKTPVSQLQELMAAQKKSLPVYVEETIGLQFKCTVYVDGIAAFGLGSTKKSAKHESAKNAIIKLQISDSTKLPSPVKVIPSPIKNYIGDLNELASKRAIPYPSYELITTNANGEFIVKCTFMQISTEGRGYNKKDAKQEAAKTMLEAVTNVNLIDLNSTPMPSNPDVTAEANKKILELFNKLTVNPSEQSSQSSNKNIINAAPELQIKIEDDIATLERKLNQYDIKYSIKFLQSNPYIACFSIENTNFILLRSGSTKDEAIHKVLYDAVLYKKLGCSIENTTSII